jgi:hypothetical protein
MHRQLILEGSDGAGKTTFANKLQSEGWRVRHVGPPSTDNFGQEVLDLLASVDGPTVWDRLYLGELVYGTMLREKHGISIGDFNLIEAWLYSAGAHHMWFNTPWEVCENRVGPAGPNGELSQKDAFERYAQAFTLSAVPMICTRNSDDQDLINWATRFLTASPIPYFNRVDREGLGSERPKFWILGEQMNLNAKLRLPFSTPAGRDLVWPVVDVDLCRVSNALESDALTPVTRARRNQFNPADVENLCSRFERLGQPQVIALGDTAKRLCMSAAIAT